MPLEIIRSDVAGKKVLLRTDPHLFRPTLTTTLLTDHLQSANIENRTILDLGCGIGPIAIGLALAGAGQVYATDIMPQACALALANAELNHVADRISFLHGNLFEPVQGLKFDMIVDDVSGVAEDVARLSAWFPPGVPSGGEDGTRYTVEILRQARDYLNPQGCLLFPVLSLSRRSRILEVAREVYNDRLTLVTTKRIPFNPRLKDNMRRLEELRSAGLIEFETIRSRGFWTLEIYQADTG
ncbi:MAG: methyltransferase [Betaproteobacteria bacterium]|nr:methyltransferase [Betaproteobacteria bacterium]MDE2359032.1 methyltransferase [Betaproteobacteria bacterium]